MVITAKFDSKCTRCFGQVHEGDRVIWNRGVKGVAHAHNCLSGDAPAEASAQAAIEEPVTIVEQAASVKPVEEPVKAASTLSDPRDPKELCAFLSSLTLDQLKALSSIVAHEISRRYERDEHIPKAA